MTTKTTQAAISLLYAIIDNTNKANCDMKENRNESTTEL